MKVKNIIIYVPEKDIDLGTCYPDYSKSCIFYDDGTYVIGTYEDGLKACETIMKERNITSTNIQSALNELLDNDVIYITTEEKFKEKFKGEYSDLKEEKKDNAVKDSVNSLERLNQKQEFIDNMSLRRGIAIDIQRRKNAEVRSLRSAINEKNKEIFDKMIAETSSIIKDDDEYTVTK